MSGDNNSVLVRHENVSFLFILNIMQLIQASQNNIIFSIIGGLVLV